MSSEWDRGVLDHSSWHGLEEIGTLPDADAAIARGEDSGAWPAALRRDALLTAGEGLPAPLSAVVADYRRHPSRVLGAVGKRYRETACGEWRDLVRAACAAGARPTGAFSLAGGSRVLATFEVGERNGISTKLLLADAFDGSLRLTCGTTSIDVVCANTLSAALSQDGEGMARLRHTRSLEEKVRVLEKSIGAAVASGEKVRAAHERASRTHLNRAAAQAAFDALFPPAAEDAAAPVRTRAENARTEALAAMALPINRRGAARGNLATLWNGATYLVDRTLEGKLRPVRGEADPLESLLFGSRAERVREIQTVIEVVLRDGTVQAMAAGAALAAGVDHRQVGRAVINDLVPGALD